MINANNNDTNDNYGGSDSGSRRKRWFGGISGSLISLRSRNSNSSIGKTSSWRQDCKCRLTARGVTVFSPNNEPRGSSSRHGLSSISPASLLHVSPSSSSSFDATVTTTTNTTITVRGDLSEETIMSSAELLSSSSFEQQQQQQSVNTNTLTIVVESTTPIRALRNIGWLSLLLFLLVWDIEVLMMGVCFIQAFAFLYKTVCKWFTFFFGLENAEFQSCLQSLTRLLKDAESASQSLLLSEDDRRGGGGRRRPGWVMIASTAVRYSVDSSLRSAAERRRHRDEQRHGYVP